MPVRVTLSDLARQLGLGKSTVQRALANAPRCSPATVELVRAAAQRLGYRPEPLFAAMGSRRRRRGGTSGVPLAYLIDRAPHDRVGKNDEDALIERAAALGYRAEFINLRERPPRRLWDALFARGVAGVLVDTPAARHRALLEEGGRFPIVCVGRGDPMPFNTARPAIVSALHLAWQRMLELGYRRIGPAILRHPTPIEDDFSRLAAALACQASQPRSLAKIPPLLTAMAPRSGVAAWVKKHRPDAVLAFHMGQYHELADAGIAVPGEVGFACLGLEDVAPEFGGFIAGVRQNRREIAVRAVDLLDQMIRHGERGVPDKPITVTVPSEWRDGGSLPARVAP